MLDEKIKKLIQYGLNKGLISKEDEIYVRNQVLALFEKDDFTPCKVEENAESLSHILNDLVEEVKERKIVTEDSIVYRDLFDTKLMGLLTPAPSVVIAKFWELYKESPKKATDYYYEFSQNTNYIRRDRIAKDTQWKVDTAYGKLDITINLSKPEKDPKAIAAAKNAKQSAYPKCLLCIENEGYHGRVNHPARQNHRIIPITIQNKRWGFQYSPYVYYNEHCIVFNSEHTPMSICHDTFCKLLDFVEQFPHYFVGSNADLPIVGGSILSHDHFQGGNYEFPMAKAPIDIPLTLHLEEGVTAGIVKWPMSVIRLTSKNRKNLIKQADHILDVWREYTDEDNDIYAYTEGEPHNTITPIARRVGLSYQMDLVLRNNITTTDRPMGLYHPRPALHHIKKENIGLIEVMGLAVLPARLKQEMEQLSQIILEKKNVREKEHLAYHADWVEEFLPKYETITKENAMGILETEIGNVFSQVLEDAGVFKRDRKGKEAFLKFINTL